MPDFKTSEGWCFYPHHTKRTIKKDIQAGKTIVIGTDSEYAIRCFTTYGEKCAKQGWKKDLFLLCITKKHNWSVVQIKTRLSVQLRVCHK